MVVEDGDGVGEGGGGNGKRCVEKGEVGGDGGVEGGGGRVWFGEGWDELECVDVMGGM